MMNTKRKMGRLAAAGFAAILALTVLSGSVFAASQTITAKKAQEIALAKVGGGTVVKCELDYDHGIQEYEVKITYNGMRYEVDLNAANGEIVRYESKAAKKPRTSAAPAITAKKAQEIALARVGGGTVVWCNLDYDDGRQEYEVNITDDSAVYEIDVDAQSGEIVKYKWKAKY